MISIDDVIYEVTGVQVMLGSETSTAKYRDYLCDKIVTRYDIF